MPTKLQEASATTKSAGTARNSTTAALRAYGTNGKTSHVDELIREYLPLVSRLAHKVTSYLRPPLSFEDLVSAGTVGLVKAARDFDASHGAGFKTYAYIRVKGAILDELRRAGMLPPNTNRQVREAMDMSRKLAQQTGMAPSDEELAEKLGMGLDQLSQLMDHARAQYFVSIDGTDPDTRALAHSLAASGESTPDRNLQRAELIDKLSEAISGLDQKRRQVVLLYYHQHMTMKQIAQVLGITESRVSQLHASAIFALSVTLRAWKDEQF